MALLTLSSNQLGSLHPPRKPRTQEAVYQEHFRELTCIFMTRHVSQSNFSIITFYRILLISTIELSLLKIFNIAVVLLLFVVVHLPVCACSGQKTTLGNWSSSPIFTWVLRTELRSLSLLVNLLVHQAILLAYFLFSTVTEYSTASSSKRDLF